MTDSKFCWFKKPSSGEKIPSAMFSTSFAKSAEISIENSPDESVFVTLFTSFPPCALIMFLKKFCLLFTCYDPCEGHTLCQIDSPTTNDQLVDLRLV